MTLWRVASSSIAALLALATLAHAERPMLKVPVLPAPALDAKLDGEAWSKAVRFDVMRGEERYGTVRMLRAGRQLYLGYESTFRPLALGVRFHFVDPATGRTVALLVAPLDLPVAPISAWLTKLGEETLRLDASGTQLRFDFTPEIGFAFVASVPLDLLEIGRPAKRFRFNLELWDTQARRPLAFYPSAPGAAGGKQSGADLEPTTDWGVDVPVGGEPPRNEAIALLEEIAKPVSDEAGEDASDQGDAISAAMGTRSGKRAEDALEKFETRLRKQIELHPDYASLHTNLARVLIGRNDPAGSLEAMRAMRKQFPDLARDSRHVLTEVQLARDAGLYEEARAALEEHAEMLKGLPDYARESAQLDAIVAAWKAEEAYRAADAKRDDLPRVRIETNRGSFVVELFEDDAPNSVANFIDLVGRGFYDGTRFHWANAPGAVMGGDPNSRDEDRFNDGYGDPGYLIEPEQNKRSNFPYTVAFISKRRSDWSMGSAFGINLSPATDRDGLDTVIGRVIDGFDVVRKLGYYDTLKKATVVRKRDHAYDVVKRPAD